MVSGAGEKVDQAVQEDLEEVFEFEQGVLEELGKCT